VTKGTILIVDDSEAVLSKAKTALNEAGFNVVTTTQTVGLGPFLTDCDLVMIDYFMPGFNGQWVLDSLRQAVKPGGPIPLFYLFTSNTSMSARYAELGFDGCFTNKGDPEYLVIQVRSALRLRDLRKLKSTKH